MENVNNQQSSIDSWQTEEVPARTKLISYICQQVRQGTTKEWLLEMGVQQYLEENNLPLFPKWDVSNMIDWCIRKVHQQSGT